MAPLPGWFSPISPNQGVPAGPYLCTGVPVCVINSACTVATLIACEEWEGKEDGKSQLGEGGGSVNSYRG